MILLITNKEDAHPTPVIERLSARGVPLFRLNTEALLTDYEFEWTADGARTDFRIRNLANGLELRQADLTAVWDRRPEKPTELPLKSSAQIDRHNLEEALGFLVFLRYYLKDVPSIGSIANDRAASSKMLQYRVAHEVGFTTPRTCYSNRKAALQRLADGCAELTVKPIENSYIWDEANMQQYVFYTQKIAADTLAGLPEEAFSQTVSFVQEYVDKAFELRITVVGERVFACRIDSQSQTDETGRIDWRQGYEHGMKHEAFDLPEEIADKCRRYLQRMGLNFGCFDFIVTPDGEYVFLECNPNGQWLWVELATGLKIADAIADFLSSQSAKNIKHGIKI